MIFIEITRGPSAILVTDISDHLPTVLISSLSLQVKHHHENNCFYRRQHIDNNGLLYFGQQNETKRNKTKGNEAGNLRVRYAKM